MDALVTEKEPLALTGNPSWELVQRIVASPQFFKSERLSSFLLFVCRLSLLGQNHKINEQNIGRAVFGRKADYDTAIDGIVRTHASRLRQRLERYFEEYGQNETLAGGDAAGLLCPGFTPRERSESAVARGRFGAATVDAVLPEPATMSPTEPGSEPGSSAKKDPLGSRYRLRCIHLDGALDRLSGDASETCCCHRGRMEGRSSSALAADVQQKCQHRGRDRRHGIDELRNSNGPLGHAGRVHKKQLCRSIYEPIRPRVLLTERRVVSYESDDGRRFPIH